MQNPLVSSYLRLIFYLLWWILPGSIHTFVLLNAFNWSVNIAIYDSVISYTILAFFSLSLWFVVRFLVMASADFSKIIRTVFLLFILVFLLWNISNYLILSLIINDYHFLFFETILWRFLLFLPVFILIIALYFLFGSLEKIKDQNYSAERMKNQLLETELNSLKSQINPHFLFNSLNSASSLVVSNPMKAREMIVRISDFFRGGLMMGKNQFVSINDELDHAINYLEIEKARFGDKIITEVHIENDLESIKVPSLILQPLLENVVKHGVYESTIPVKILIKVGVEGGSLLLSVTNNMDKTVGSEQKGTGTGLKNINARLELIYQKTDLMWIEKTNEEFKVQLRIPLN